MLVILCTAAVSGILATATVVQAGQKTGTKTKSGGVNIMLMKPTAAKTGDNAFEVMVKGANGKPIANADVSVALMMPAMPAMKMPAMHNEVMLKPASTAGTYTGTGQVMMAGKWNVTVTVKQGGKEIGRKKLTLTAK